MGQRNRHLGWWLRRALGAALVLFLATSLFVEFRYGDRIRQPAQAPAAPVAIVFGAGLVKGEPSPVLAQRMDAAIALYREGRVGKILVTGDNNSDRYHDETQAMTLYATARGVPLEDVMGDEAGLSTYDSCYRAKQVFGVDKALLVTQDFHLPRALFIANSLGIEAWGVAADAQPTWIWDYEVRELFSRSLALAMVLVRAEPRLLDSGRPAAANR